MFGVRINGGGYSRVVSNLTFSTSTDTLGMQAEFEIAYRTKELVHAGDTVHLTTGEDIFSTLKVIDVQRDGIKPRKVTCFDYGFYLNENEVIIQFKNIPADQALKELLGRFGISARITSLPYKIKKIYKGEKVSDVIRDILEQCTAVSGIRYFFEMRNKTLVIDSIYNNRISRNFNIILNPSTRESMQNLKNQVVIVTDDSDSIQTYTTVKDDNSIRKYGLLQKVEQIGAEDKAKAQKIAQETLKALNKLELASSLEVLGELKTDLRANSIITLNEPKTGMSGDYLIKSAVHTVKNSTSHHTVKLEVEKL